jgi:hypothetical protein
MTFDNYYYEVPELRITLKQLFQMAKRTGKQPKALLEKLMDLKYEEEAKLRGLV